MQFYPGFHTVQLTLDPVRQGGFSELADEILEQARRIGGEQLTEKYPVIPIGKALANWDQLEDMAFRLATVSM